MQASEQGVQFVVSNTLFGIDEGQGNQRGTDDSEESEETGSGEHMA